LAKAAVFYRTLDVEAILETLRRLERRISERFPGSGLLSICHELVSLAEDVQQRAKAIAAPNVALRTAVYIIIVAGVVGLLIIAFAVKFQIGNAELLTVLQAVEAAANIVVLLGAALFFLMLSLTSKLAAVYAQNLPDPVVIDAVNEIESLTTNLSQKIWQKIRMVDELKRASFRSVARDAL
jgi:hypothetical protein